MIGLYHLRLNLNGGFLFSFFLFCWYLNRLGFVLHFQLLEGMLNSVGMSEGPTLKVFEQTEWLRERLTPVY